MTAVHADYTAVPVVPADQRVKLALLIDPNALEVDAYPFPLDAADRVLSAGWRPQRPATPQEVDAGAAVLASAFIPGIPWEHCGPHERAELRTRARAFLEAVEAARP
jgi:hypothetical protein